MRWRIGAVGTGTRHKVRSVHSRSNLFSDVFGCFYAFDIANTETKNEVSQCLMRF